LWTITQEMKVGDALREEKGGLSRQSTLELRDHPLVLLLTLPRKGQDKNEKMERSALVVEAFRKVTFIPSEIKTRTEGKITPKDFKKKGGYIKDFLLRRVATKEGGA